MAHFVQQLINGLSLGAIYGLIAIGYTMVYGIIGMVNFAHGEIYMIGAFHALITYLVLGGLGLSYVPAMTETALPLVAPRTDEQTEPRDAQDPGYLVVCWDDPVNLMDYVTHVFQVVFGWPKQKAETHMLQVHNQGKSVLVRESLEKAEHYVHQLHRYSLHATLERDQ